MGREVELRTARLLLRTFRTTDIDDVHYRDDPEFARYLPHIPQPFTRADAELFVAVNMTESWETQPTFAIVLDDHVIGQANLEIDSERRSAMIGYGVARAHWGKGFAIEAVRALVAWAIAEHDLVEIWASTDLENARSRRVLEKLGLVLVGRETVDGHNAGRPEARYRLAVARPAR